MEKKQFNTPLTSFLRDYAAQNMVRAHMPGHDGHAPEFVPELKQAYTWDITEIQGADSLYESEGILRDAEARMAGIYGSGACCWSAGGSTLCIQAMLMKMKMENRLVIAARLVHRSFIHSCVLLDLAVQWIFPQSGGLLSGEYCLTDFEEILDKMSMYGNKCCVYVTSPSYLGTQLDIAALAAICKRYHAPLLVDNAHGTHLAFLEQNQHPIALGADYCCDSAHKTLPALTGAAMLHCRDAKDAAEMKLYMQTFGSTSPSYLVMQSLENCSVFLENGGIQRIRETARLAQRLKERLKEQYTFCGTDPLHLTLRLNGTEFAGQLREHGVECEYADGGYAVLLLSADFRDFTRLEKALLACQPKPAKQEPPLPAPPPRFMGLRESVLAEYVILPLWAGRDSICGPVLVSCPPAIPILVSGERIADTWIPVMEYYGIRTLAIVKQPDTPSAYKPARQFTPAGRGSEIV